MLDAILKRKEPALQLEEDEGQLTVIIVRRPIGLYGVGRTIVNQGVWEIGISACQIYRKLQA